MLTSRQSEFMCIQVVQVLLRRAAHKIKSTFPRQVPAIICCCCLLGRKSLHRHTALRHIPHSHHCSCSGGAAIYIYLVVRKLAAPSVVACTYFLCPCKGRGWKGRPSRLVAR